MAVAVSSVGRREPVERAVRRLQGRRRDVGVDRGGPEVAVPEQHLDRPDVGAGLQQMGREAVAQGVDGDVLAQARGAGGLDAGPVHRPGGQGPPGRLGQGRASERGGRPSSSARRTSSSRGESMT